MTVWPDIMFDRLTWCNVSPFFIQHFCCYCCCCQFSSYFVIVVIIVVAVVVVIFCRFVIAVSEVFAVVVAIIVWQTTHVYDKPESTYTHFYHSLSSFQTSTIFEENFLNFFGLAPSPILAEFNTLIGFCLRPPRLDLYSFWLYFELFPDLTNFFGKIFLIYFGLTSPPILAEFNAPIGFCLRQPRLDLYSFSSFLELFPDVNNFWGKTLEFFWLSSFSYPSWVFVYDKF